MSKGILLRRHSCGKGIDMSLYENQYLTTEALESGTITFTMPSAVNTSKVTDVSYRKNGGEWATTANSSSEVVVTVDVDTDDVVEWKGNGTGYGGGGAFADCCHWGGTASFNVYGNLMSMLYNDGFRGKTTYPTTTIRATQHMFSYALVVDATNLVLPATTCYGQAYMCLFDYCKSLIYPPAVLPAPTVKSAMYYNMFRGCTSLTTMPTILATSIDTAGTLHYSGMFQGCSALQYNTEQTIGVGIARTQCCQSMFHGCSSMVNAPNVDCTSIASGVQQPFRSMFQNCTNLQTPPERFDVETADYNAFYGTFANCSSLLYAPIINIRNVGTRTYYAFDEMFANCSSLIDASGINIYFPENSQWDGEQTFYQMFYGCASLVNSPSLHINGTLITKSARTFGGMFFNCQNMETHDIELNYTIDSNATITTGTSYGNGNMFYHCYKMKSSPRITRLALRDYEFYRAFDGNSQLRDVYVKFNTNTAGNALDNWLANTGSLSGIRAIHQAGSLSLPDNSTSGIPSKWLLDQGDWTTQRHARMTMWFDDYDIDVYGIDDCYALFGNQLNDFLTTISYGTSANIYHYYGDTLTLDGVTYFVWENNLYEDDNPYKLLTTTDNFYELKKESGELLNQTLQPSTNEEKLQVLTVPFTHLYGMLENDVIKYDDAIWPTGRHLMAIKRNQG